MYCFIPGKGEAAYENWPLADVLLFSGPILSENAKCTAIAYDFKYAAPGWNGETAFSKEDVLRAGGDVKWIEREGSEPACLEYTFDGLQMRVYTDDDGAGILRDRNVLLKEQSAEKLFGLQDIDIKQDLIAAEKGKVGTLLYDYVDCLGKTQEEITENLPGNYKFNVNGSMRELDDNIEYIFFEGYCYGINIPVEVAFPDLGNESGFEYVKDLDMPFSYQLSTPGSTWYKIEFEEFVIYIMADESMNILADDQVVIQRR
ncbi:MAG: hypothetical protein LBP73_00855 [Clostridiales Family XIII bacterium]|nr:hypothetical protein [Clostridiales Family XIII bacterium]